MVKKSSNHLYVFGVNVAILNKWIISKVHNIIFPNYFFVDKINILKHIYTSHGNDSTEAEFMRLFKYSNYFRPSTLPQI